MGLYDWLGFSNCVGFYLLRYNQTLRSLYLDEIKLTPSSPTPHSYWGRRASFSPVGVNNIAPYINVCFVGFWNGQMVKVKPFSLAFGATTPVSFYGYSTVASWYIPNTHTHILFLLTINTDNSLVFCLVVWLFAIHQSLISGLKGLCFLNASSLLLMDSGVLTLTQQRQTFQSRKMEALSFLLVIDSIQ
jgi:hypothetical protein